MSEKHKNTHYVSPILAHTSKSRDSTGYNEDRKGFRFDTAWVLDGASQPGETTGDFSTQEYVDRLNYEIFIHTNPSLTLKQILKQALTAMKTVLDAHSFPLLSPAATIAMVRVKEDEYEWLLLGDSGILFRDKGQYILMSDTRLSLIAIEERKAFLEAKKEKTSDGIIFPLWQALYEKEASSRNQPGGYFVAADDPGAVDHALTGTMPLLGSAFLFTDGITDAIGKQGAWKDAEDAYNSWMSSIFTTNNLSYTQAIKDIPIQAQTSLLHAGEKVDDATLVLISKRNLIRPLLSEAKSLRLQTSSARGKVKHILSLPNKRSTSPYDTEKITAYIQKYLDLHGEILLSNCELANVVSGRTGVPVYIVQSIVRELTI